jgi:hypothetical protein
MLQRHDDRYSDTLETHLFLDRAKPSYVGGLLEMANARLYPFWGSLTEGLRTGQMQNEAKSGDDFFGVLYQEPARLRQFLHAMTGVSMAAATAIAQKFPWEKYSTFVDTAVRRAAYRYRPHSPIRTSRAEVSISRRSSRSSKSTLLASVSPIGCVSIRATSSPMRYRARTYW